MSEISVRSRNGYSTAGELRVLGGLWLAGVAATTVPAFLLVAVSDHTADRLPGLVLGTLVLVGLAVGGWLVTAPRTAALAVSVGASVAWLAGGALVYRTQDFTADAVWAGGVPVLVAVLTGLVAGWIHRRA